MTYEPRDRPRGLFARLRNLVRGMFAVWLRDSEVQNPRAIYEQAIQERANQYRQLKEAVAGILYMRNKLEAEITADPRHVGVPLVRAQHAGTGDDPRGFDAFDLVGEGFFDHRVEAVDRHSLAVDGFCDDAELSAVT